MITRSLNGALIASPVYQQALYRRRMVRLLQRHCAARSLLLFNAPLPPVSRGGAKLWRASLLLLHVAPLAGGLASLVCLLAWQPGCLAHHFAMHTGEGTLPSLVLMCWNYDGDMVPAPWQRWRETGENGLGSVSLLLRAFRHGGDGRTWKSVSCHLVIMCGHRRRHGTTAASLHLATFFIRSRPLSAGRAGRRGKRKSGTKLKNGKAAKIAKTKKAKQQRQRAASRMEPRGLGVAARLAAAPL